MPYYISNDNPNCDGWAVEKADGEVLGCHDTRQDAIDQMVALSVAEDIEPGGERSVKALTASDFEPPQGAREEARRGLEWRREYGRGGTLVGVARARDIANGRQLSPETIARMVSYFARHEVDKQGEGWSPDEDGYPSAGRIAWALWGGDPGRTWANAMQRRIRAEEDSSSRGPDGSRSTGPGEMNVKHSTATFAVKAATNTAPGGKVEALVSVFNNTDLVGDRVMPGAFEKSLARYTETGKAIPFVWSHQWDDPTAYIGKVTSAVETKDGLMVEADLFDTPTAQHIRTLLKEGVVTEFSFAYDIIKAAPGKDGVNELTELHILEAGPTLKGANPATQLVGVRAYNAAVSRQAAKAEPGELALGDFVESPDGYGRVEYVMTEGEFGIEGDPLSLPATADDPLALVRMYEEGDEGWVATDLFTAHRFSALSAEGQEPTGAQNVEGSGKAAPRIAAKAGRVLSAKNEDRIKQAQTLLGEVLSTIETAEKSAPDDDAPAVEAYSETDADALLALLELEEIDSAS